jgi:hypothetical protein
MPKPNPDRVQATWDLLEGPPSDEETAAEVARIAKLTPRELDRELEDGGFDLRQVEANAESLRQRLMGAAAESPGVAADTATHSESPPRTATAVDAIAPRARPVRRRGELFSSLAIAAVLLALAIGFALRPHRGPEVPIARPDFTSLPSPSATPSATPTEPVALRTRAAAACDSGAWTECRDLLDRAARLDPAGEGDPAIRAMRERVMEYLPAPIGPKPRP